ncbi:hypothetical protein BU23DRAFT_562066 [Bimuria novae-zelandiae CBS 107.79]|uniref:Uncharacterized protein n=1 Tax=Bimuria novae-zelandiae CBS 107.79 TaxID=1447943 RepID=A0A6A5UIV9_9PLEO|nr:hypothetical protein BU23DRAFT_562066 [Bimuria novae-zelandiae CBS 107.79]
MALRRQNLSPAATLLRNSRLFSLPNPLPRPPVSEPVAAGVEKVSNTATLPFPTHQAIATTPKSLARGDWGLKRPLPSRSRLLQISDPVVKVKQLDTIEHITDFDSATDHVRTRQKFEELSIPMMKGMAAMRGQVLALPTSGAFERRSDVTSYEEDEGLDEAGKILETIRESVGRNAAHKKQQRGREFFATKFNKKPHREDEFAKTFVPFELPQPDEARHNVRRWKHEGPWLPGMSADEFTKYMTTQLIARKAEFNRYLRHYAKNQIYVSRVAAAKSANVPDNPLDLDMHLEQQESEEYTAQQAKEWSNITDEEIDARIKKLRSEAAVDPLQSKLVQNLIMPFLRIPSIKIKNTNYAVNSKSEYRFDDDVAPLSTHPSAGLGYLRTNAYMNNHPILGPQGEHTPVKARVIEPRTASRKNFARVGVAGFVANDDHHGASEKYALHQVASDPTYEIDIHTEGGAKINVLPRFGSVTSDGRIHIKLNRSVGAEVQVANGALEDRPPERTIASEAGSSDMDMLRNLSGMSRSGAELDEQSPQAQQFMQFVDPNVKNPFAVGGFGGFPSRPKAETQSFDEMRPDVEEAIRGEHEKGRT